MLKRTAHLLLDPIDLRGLAPVRRWLLDRDVGRRHLARGTEFDTNAIVVSIPKSGRTWLRVLLANYFCSVAEEPFTLEPSNIRLAYTHDLWEHLTAPRLSRFVSGRGLIPPSARRTVPIVLVARDPRDVIVSLFFHTSKRQNRYSGTLSEMIRHPLFGIEPIVLIMNAWMDEWAAAENALLTRYEDWQASPETSFGRIVSFVQPDRQVDWNILRAAVKRSSFESMQAMEREHKFDNRILQPRNPEDLDSYKVRSGRVGGYVDYLNADDIAWLEKALERLDRRYGYEIPGGRDEIRAS